MQDGAADWRVPAVGRPDAIADPWPVAPSVRKPGHDACMTCVILPEFKIAPTMPNAIFS